MPTPSSSSSLAAAQRSLDTLLGANPALALPSSGDQRDSFASLPDGSIIFDLEKSTTEMFIEHFAELIHAIYLVTQTERSQRARPYSSLLNSDQSQRNGHVDSGIISTFATPRWLLAVGELLKRTVTLHHLAWAAHLFPHWLQVVWRRDVLQGTLLKAQLSLSVQHVVSAEEARTWLSGLSCEALTEKRGELSHINPSLAAAAQFKQAAMASAPTSMPDGKHPRSTKPAKGKDAKRQSSASSVKMTRREREKLVAMISPDLRQSLSEEKLEQLLVQLRREVRGEDIEEYRLVEKKKMEERLVQVYNHLRSLFRGKQTVLSFAQAMDQLETQGCVLQGQPLSRAVEQLATIPHSGLSLILLSASPAVQQPSKGGRKGGRRSKQEKETVVPQARMIMLTREDASIQSVAEAVSKL